MNAVFRTAWTLVSLPALLALALAVGLLWLTASDQEFVKTLTGPGRIFLQGMLGVAFMAGLLMLLLRIAKVVEAGVWRLLPGGYRTVIRATGLIMLVLIFCPGSNNLSSKPSRLANVPFGGKLADVIFFTLLCLPLLASIGRRQPRHVIVAYVIACMVALNFMVTGFAEVPAFWFATAGLCAAAWMYASFGNLPYPRAGSWWQRLHAPVALPKLAFGRVRIPLLSRSPASELLLSRRGVRSGLPYAALVIVVWTGFQHAIVSNRAESGKFIFGYPAVLGITMFLVVLMSQDVGAAARTLWLRWGNSRAELFGLAERTLFRDAAILCILAWGMVTLFAWLYGPAIDARGALKMLAAYLCAAFAPIYLALSYSTFHAFWQRLTCAALCVGAVSLLAFRWLDALGGSAKAIKRIDGELLLVLFIMLLVLRALASWRWRTIDWTYFRQERRKQ